MNMHIDHVNRWLNCHVKLKQWLWMMILWMSGFVTMAAIAYPIKWLVKNLG